MHHTPAGNHRWGLIPAIHLSQGSFLQVENADKNGAEDTCVAVLEVIREHNLLIKSQAIKKQNPLEFRPSRYSVDGDRAGLHSFIFGPYSWTVCMIVLQKGS